MRVRKNICGFKLTKVKIESQSTKLSSKHNGIFQHMASETLLLASQWNTRPSLFFDLNYVQGLNFSIDCLN